MDFTPVRYQQLLETLQSSDLSFQLRHDVDLRPESALRVAQVEAEMGAKATYYFRAMHFDSHADTIKAIAALGHEAGYHYESLTSCGGDMAKAYEDFCRNLERLRQIVPVTTACAHGSPRSPWNSQDIWKLYDIHALGIDYEPMIDTDFSQTLYLTDTGRRWDGWKYSIRDKVNAYQPQWTAMGLAFHGTNDIINALHNPDHILHRSGFKLLITTHPQRWQPFGRKWLQEIISQTIKNQVKRHLAQ
mgnify:CR=1 FL=1